MSIKRRGNKGIWWTRFTAPNGRRIFQSTQTTHKRQAQEYEDKLKTELWRIQKLGERPSYLWQHAVLRWFEEQGHKASIESDRLNLRWLDGYFFDLPLEDINRQRIDEVIQAKLKTGVSNATVNRVLQVLRALLRRAEREWEWLDKTPVFRLLPEKKRRVRWLTPEEAQHLLRELPIHLRELAIFSMATGLRQSNVTGLEWTQVDLIREFAWIHPDQAKARKAIKVPLNHDAFTVVRRQLGRHKDRVFTFHAKPITQVTTKAWRKALDRAGIRLYDDGLPYGDARKLYPTGNPDEYKYTDFRWHDLRHTWASWHVQAGTPLHVLQELGGWASVEMVQRYAHFSAEHLADYAKNIESKVVSGAILVAV
jgi:integrase